VVARTSCCSDQSKDDQTDHDQNLGAAEPKLEFSEEPNAEVVNCDDCSQEKRYIESRVCAWAIMLSCLIKPEPYDESRSNQIVRGGDYVFEPVIPTFELSEGCWGWRVLVPTHQEQSQEPDQRNDGRSL
jgi:hypothetical protein